MKWNEIDVKSVTPSSIDTQEDYGQARALLSALTIALDGQRCSNCENREHNQCSAYSVTIPATHIYTVNDCEKHCHDIPF